MSNSFKYGGTIEQQGIADCWAEIRTAGEAIRYRRIGIGHPVLVLAEELEICPNVAQALTEDGSLRLLVPELPGEGVHIAGWVADFLEGIGATSVCLLATGSFCIDAIEMAMSGSEQIERVVLVANEPGRFGRWCEGAQRGTLESDSRANRVPILFIHKGEPLAEVGPLVRAFLGEP